MTTLSTDTYIRTDQSGLGTASDGESWVRDAGIGVSNIVSNQGKIGPGGGDSQFLIGSQTTAPINISARVKSGDSGNVAAILFRYNTSGGTNGYRAGIFGGNLICDKYVSGSRSNIGSTSVGYNTGEEWFVRAIASGTSIKITAWKDGTSEPGSPQLNLTDSSTTTAGQYGISVFMSNDFTYFDSLTATDGAVAIALTGECDGVGTLSGTASLSTVLSTTIAGNGTLTGTFTLTTALSGTLSGIGSLNGTMSANTAIASTIAGSGTLNGVLILSTALICTLAGVGTLNGTTTLFPMLAVAMAGTGRLAGALTLMFPVSQQVPGIARLQDALINQATASDVSIGSVALSDQG